MMDGGEKLFQYILTRILSELLSLLIKLSRPETPKSTVRSEVLTERTHPSEDKCP